MKKNKTMPYALSALLLVGGTFVGTKALFTDTTSVASELVISTGDLDIEVTQAGTWELERNGEEHQDGTTRLNDSSTIGVGERLGEDKAGQTNESVPTAGAFANNLKPGDVLTKTVTIENKGTLVATDITLSATGENETLEDGLLKLTTGTLSKTELKPGDTATFTLELLVQDVDVDKVHGQGFNTDTQENKNIDLNKVWTLTASQQNTDFGKDNVE